ncbi:Putative MetA-pathway of phenol degradation [Microbulbifer donghaiensis]|uniref:Putative MetA-pathway of phenol degradation n=1 Tax=Microbulbifer donghaiensis TaxID=494016 RepID=A0A1M4WHX2_9GAMM|nr:transporter [Microbulbifer donghaiensis]SHE80839.1 Putative MetA-pathway of phenol degradation [Microbulbifer donghaiensis]
MRQSSLATVSAGFFLAFPVNAETPAFDRPGTGFSVTTLPAGTFAWEQGLPDASRDKSTGVTETLYRADALIRAGLLPNLELQISHSPYNYLRETGPERTRKTEGASGTGFSLKYALPDLGDTLSWAVLGGTTIDTGNTPFSPDDTIYSLGTSLEWQRQEDRSLSLYFNIDQSDSESTITISPSYSATISPCTGAYVELDYIHVEGNSQMLIGGGITRMVTETVQLDLYSNIGLNSNSADWQAGFGFSVFFE